MIASRSTDSVVHVYSQDPAIDKDHPDFDWDRFKETGEMKYLPIKEGQTPTVFQIRRLTRRQFLKVIKSDDAEQFSEAVAYGLRGIKDWGAPVDLKFQGDGQERLHPDTLDRIFAVELFVELGARIMELSRLAPLSKSA